MSKPLSKEHRTDRADVYADVVIPSASFSCATRARGPLDPCDRSAR